MVSTLIKGLILGIIILTIPTIYFEIPSLFYPQTSVQSMYVYTQSQPFSIRQYTAPTTVGGITIGGFGLNGWSEPNWNISDLQVTFNDVFSDSNVHFEITYNNLSIAPLGWYSVGNGYNSVNSTEVFQYIQNNPPDLLITFPAIKNSNYFCYKNVTDIDAFVFGNNYAKSVSSCSLLKRISFDTWEAEILLGSSGDTVNLTSINPKDNRTFISVPIQSMTLEFSIPSHYQIQNIGDMSVQASNTELNIKKSLTSGETLDLIITDSNLVPIQSIMNYVSGLGLSILFLSLLIDAIIEHRKSKSEQNSSKQGDKGNQMFSNNPSFKPTLGKPKRNRKRSRKRR